MSHPENFDAQAYGPLGSLIGTWVGDKGMDLAPEPDGPDLTPYYETITFETVGDVENAEEQLIMALYYRQVVRKKENDEVFHDQTGYWMWDEKSQVVVQSLSIPRAVCLLAGAKYEAQAGDEVVISVSASVDDPDWSIIQSPFMRDKAKTLAFSHTLKVNGDKLSYAETTSLDIYGSPFEHTDQNELTRQKDA